MMLLEVYGCALRSLKKHLALCQLVCEYVYLFLLCKLCSHKISPRVSGRLAKKRYGLEIIKRFQLSKRLFFVWLLPLRKTALIPKDFDNAFYHLALTFFNFIKKPRDTILAGFLILCSGHVFAHDLGTHAKVFPIEEVDIRLIMAKEFSQIDVVKLRNLIRKSAREYTSHLAPAPLTTVDHNFTYYVDPSIALKRNISWQGQLIYRKGTWVNPLWRVRPHANMLFFDARAPSQRAFALKLLKEHPYNLILLATGGDPVKIAKVINRPVYYAFKPIVDHFEIKHVPSMLYPFHIKALTVRYENYL